MATFKLTISDTKGRSVSRDLKDAEAGQLVGASIGTSLDAAILGLAGKLTITGGSDKSGVPMRSDVHGGARKYVMISRGVGLPRAPIGQRIRKLIRGRDVTEEIFQVNCRYDGILEEPKTETPTDDAKASTPTESTKDSETPTDDAKASTPTESTNKNSETPTDDAKASTPTESTNKNAKEETLDTNAKADLDQPQPNGDKKQD